MEDDLNVSEAVAGVETSDGGSTVEESGNEPSTMLEAIEQGLKVDSEESTETQQEEKKEDASAEDTPAIEEEQKTEDDETPPEGISKKAQERFQRLVTKVKEKDEEISRVRADLDGIRHVMKDTGASPEDFGKMFDYMKALNSGDMDRVRSVLEEQIRQYTLMTGRQFSQVDPLAQFPDLRERVNGYQMDEQTAIEMARHRTEQHHQQQAASQYQQRQQSEQQTAQVRQSAIQQIDRMGAEWSKRDPDFAQKEEIILKQIPIISKQFPPSQWAQQVEILYNTISAMPIQKAVQSAPPPLRPSGQSAGAKQPANMFEAIASGLGYSGG